MKLSKLVSSMLFVAGIALGSVNVAVAVESASGQTAAQQVTSAQAALTGKSGDALKFAIAGLVSAGYTTDAIASALVNLNYSYTAASAAMQSAGISAAAAGTSLVAAGLTAPSTAGGTSAGGGTGGSSFGSIASAGGGSGGGGGGTVSPTR
jgi:hypothetical protein